MLELNEITRVEDLTSSEDVNAYLELGWKILNTYTTAYDTIGAGASNLTMHFVMAWTGADPKYPPRTEHPSIGLVL